MDTEFKFRVTIVLRSGTTRTINATWVNVLTMLNNGIKVTIFVPSQNRTIIVTKQIAQTAIDAFVQAHEQEELPPPPPTTLNVAFTIRYSDGFSDNWILTNADFNTLDNMPPTVDYAITNIQDTNKQASSLSLVLAQIKFKKDTQINDEINVTMVAQSVGAFSISENRIKGTVNYIANSSFNPFWYGKPIQSILQFKDLNGSVIGIKFNSITFTETERDEIISINESAFNSSPITIEFFVQLSDSDPRAFADPKRIEVEQGKAPPPDPPPITQKQDTLFKVFKGLLFGSFALALLGSRGK